MTPQVKLWIFRLLGVAGAAVLVLVLVYFLKRWSALKTAEVSIAQERKQTKPDGTPVLPPPTSTPPIVPGNTPPVVPGNTPPVQNEVSSHIEKMCWMTDMIVQTKGTPVQRCEICNNLDTMSSQDLAFWAKTYQQWYGRSLKTDLSTKFFDCGCIPFFCSCSKPQPTNIAKLP